MVSDFQEGICQFWFSQPHRWTSGSHPTLMESVPDSLGRNMHTLVWMEVILWGSLLLLLSWCTGLAPSRSWLCLRAAANLLETVNTDVLLLTKLGTTSRGTLWKQSWPRISHKGRGHGMVCEIWISICAKDGLTLWLTHSYTGRWLNVPFSFERCVCVYIA